MPTVKADTTPLEEIELEAMWLRLEASGILCVELKGNAAFDLSDAQAYASACSSICNDQPRPFLILQPQSLFHSTAQARDFLAESPVLKQLRSALAIVASDAGNRLAALAYLNTNKPIEQRQLFADANEARSWLLSYL